MRRGLFPSAAPHCPRIVTCLALSAAAAASWPPFSCTTSYALLAVSAATAPYCAGVGEEAGGRSGEAA